MLLQVLMSLSIYTTTIKTNPIAIDGIQIYNQHSAEEALKESGPDVQRMVMGHTPQNKINSALDGKAWRIDVGASKGVMGGTPEVLEIIHRGGENDEDIVNVLTEDGKQINGKERSVADAIILDLFDMKR